MVAIQAGSDTTRFLPAHKYLQVLPQLPFANTRGSDENTVNKENTSLTIPTTIDDSNGVENSTTAFNNISPEIIREFRQFIARVPFYFDTTKLCNVGVVLNEDDDDDGWKDFERDVVRPAWQVTTSMLPSADKRNFDLTYISRGKEATLQDDKDLYINQVLGSADTTPRYSCNTVVFKSDLVLDNVTTSNHSMYLERLAPGVLKCCLEKNDGKWVLDPTKHANWTRIINALREHARDVNDQPVLLKPLAFDDDVLVYLDYSNPFDGEAQIHYHISSPSTEPRGNQLTARELIVFAAWQALPRAWLQQDFHQFSPIFFQYSCRHHHKVENVQPENGKVEQSLTENESSTNAKGTSAMHLQLSLKLRRFPCIKNPSAKDHSNTTTSTSDTIKLELIKTIKSPKALCFICKEVDTPGTRFLMCIPEKAIRREIDAYNVLKDMQTQYIPRCYGAFMLEGDTDDDDEACKVLMLDMIPSMTLEKYVSVYRPTKSMMASVYLLAKDILRKIHDRNVLYGSVAARNILIHMDPPPTESHQKVYFVDSERAVHHGRYMVPYMRDEEEYKLQNIFAIEGYGFVL